MGTQYISSCYCVSFVLGIHFLRKKETNKENKHMKRLAEQTHINSHVSHTCTETSYMYHYHTKLKHMHIHVQ